MSTNILVVLVALLIVISVVIWIIKLAIVRVIMVGILGIVVYVLFHVAFIWSFEEVDNVLHFDKWLAPETVESLSGGFQEFEVERGEHAVIDQQLMAENIDKAIGDAKTSAGNAYESIDQEALRKQIILEYEKYGKEAVDQALLELEEQLEKEQTTP